MFRFANISGAYYFFALLAIALVFLYFMWWRKRSLDKLGDAGLLSQLAPFISMRRIWTKFILVMLVMAFMVLGYMQPQYGTKFEKVKKSGIDLVIALDISKSMHAKDVIAGDRMLMAKSFVSKLLGELGNDRVGLVVFAGNATVQMPLTTDKGAAKLFLETISPKIAASQGTNIGEAIEVAIESFDSEDKKYKAILIISDGEDHEGNVEAAIADANDKGILIHTLGVGGTRGEPIPVYDKRGNQTGYKRDRENKVVMTAVNEDMLKSVAVDGNGTYIQLTSPREATGVLLEAIAEMEQREYDEDEIADYEDRFQYAIMLAIFLLTLEFFLSERKSNIFAGLNLFETETKDKEL